MAFWRTQTNCLFCPSLCVKTRGWSRWFAAGRGKTEFLQGRSVTGNKQFKDAPSKKKNPKENRRGIAGDSARQDPDVMLKWQLPRNLLHAPMSLSSRHIHLPPCCTHTLCFFFFFRILDSQPNINTRFPSPPWYPLLLALYLRSISDVLHSGSRAVFYSLYKCLTVGTACCIFFSRYAHFCFITETCVSWLLLKGKNMNI